ncbi:hypothetical protein KGF54_003015 [Candida jiufengensis]|uniref:uncharacterized protein n=1 Tax=Candida jiufengensis TaxID=497108 RepID=UPI002225857B|nr:uncharacterized protein KGF54_003015 [Candida jiufengensis]KAI5953643.1 hypothetical protein KGF54_003015 [Candida jiufengensis]
MKFAVPDELLVAEIDSINSLPPSILRRAKNAKISPILPQKSSSKQENDFKNMFEAIRKHTNDWIASKNREIEQNQLNTLLSLEQENNEANLNISILTENFTKKINIQDLEVGRLIEEEREKKRLREEAERLRKEEEQRLKRLEEERIRKEEEAKREQERKRLEAEKLKKEQEALRQKQEEQERIAAEKAKQDAEAKAKLDKQKQLEQQEAQNNSSTNFSQIEKQFLKYKQDIVDIKKNVVETLKENKELKKQVNQFKRQINPKFGQLSNSTQHTNTICQEIYGFVQKTQSNKLVYEWILNFIAKAIIDQAETEVIVRPVAARPLALLSYFLLQNFPEFEYFLTARFIKKCPYIIGYTSNTDSEEGRLRMGYKRNEDGKWEDDVKYDERISGICLVWAVMTHERSVNESIGIYSQPSSWQFIARILNTNLSLIRNTHFELIANWWEGTGRELLGIYGEQGKKIAYLMFTQFIGAVSDRRYPSAARLHLVGEEWLQRGKIESLKSMER